jgi:lipid-A-disaccharide synthase-like uncharacterized protein
MTGPSEPSKRKRLKWEPAALMVLVLSLGLWAAFGPASGPKFPLSEGSFRQDVRIGDTRGVLEMITSGASGPSSSASPVFKLWMRNGPSAPRALSRAEAESLFGAALVERAMSGRRNWLFRTFNITSWVNVVWVGIGLLGQLAFSGRMVLQWIVSERRRESVITESFWWFSLFGSVILFSYFVFRQDPVALLGQASGMVIYLRNLRLIYKRKARAARAKGTPDPA